MEQKNIAKNTLFFTIALAMQKVISFVYFMFVARSIGVENTGKFSFALSFTTIFAMIMDFGTAQVLIRESARNKDEAQKYLSSVLGLKLAASLLVYGAVIGVINLMGYPELTKQLVYVSGVVMLIDSFALTFYSILRGLQNLKYESIGVVINQLIILIAGLVVLYLDLGLVILISVYFLGSLFNLLYASLLLAVKYKVFPMPKLNKVVIKKIIAIALPFAIAGFFIRIYSYMDIIMLSKMTNDEAVGWYSVAYKVAFALQFVGVAFSAAVYPAFCNYFVSSKELLAKSFSRSMFYLIFLAMPLSVGVITIADKIIGPMFGVEYNNSVLPLQILMVSLILIFLAFPVGAMLNAANRQTRNTIHLAIVAIANIIFNLILIPLYSYVGAAIAALLSYILLFGLGIYVVNQIVDYDKKYLWTAFVKILFCCLAMGIVVLYLKQSWSFLIVVPVAVLIYLILAYASRIITKGDLTQIKLLLLRRQ